MNDYFITDFLNPLFQTAFKDYFKELGVNVKDWNSLFHEMNADKETVAFLRTDSKGKTVGFIQFKKDEMKNWFFTEKIGFIREFWVANEFRKQGQGTALLNLAEQYFVENDIYKTILTTNTVPNFYIKHGYVKDISYNAKNNYEVYVKMLK